MIAQEETKQKEEQRTFEEELRKLQEQKAKTEAEIDGIQGQTAELMERVNTIRAQQDKDRDSYESMIANAQQAVNSTAEQIELYRNEVMAAIERADSM